MTLPVFVVDSDALHAHTVELAGDEGHHAAVVKRIKPGEHLVVTDGRGAGAACRVQTVSKHGLVADVLWWMTERPPQPRLVVVQAIPKGDHAERAVDLVTEVGADMIVPWAASRNVVTWKRDREAKALNRWRAIAQAAAKQSRRLWFPSVTSVQTTAQVAELIEGAALALVLDEGAEASIAEIDMPERGDVVLVVGPEGGITPDESASFVAAGARPVLLGPTVLRSSTAGVVAAAIVLSRTTRWT